MDTSIKCLPLKTNLLLITKSTLLPIDRQIKGVASQ